MSGNAGGLKMVAGGPQWTARVGPANRRSGWYRWLVLLFTLA